MGFSTGVILGLAIALPGPNDVITPLSKEEITALESGYLSEEFRQSICKKYEASLKSKRDQSPDVSICGSSNKPLRHYHHPL